jgi:hypothetical protein
MSNHTDTLAAVVYLPADEIDGVVPRHCGTHINIHCLEAARHPLETYSLDGNGVFSQPERKETAQFTIGRYDEI